MTLSELFRGASVGALGFATRQLALFRYAIAIFELAPNRVQKFTILCRRQSLDDLIRAPSRIVRGAP